MKSRKELGSGKNIQQGERKKKEEEKIKKEQIMWKGMKNKN